METSQEGRKGSQTKDSGYDFFLNATEFKVFYLAAVESMQIQTAAIKQISHI